MTREGMTYLYSYTSTFDLVAATVLWGVHLVLLSQMRRAITWGEHFYWQRMATWAAVASVYCFVEAFSWPWLELGAAWLMRLV